MLRKLLGILLFAAVSLPVAAQVLGDHHTRRVTSSKEPYYNVKSRTYGALGNGATGAIDTNTCNTANDDAVEINLAVTAMEADDIDGSVLYFPPGIYCIGADLLTNDRIVIANHNNFSIKGENATIVIDGLLNVSSSGAVFSISGSNDIEISGIRIIDPDAATNSGAEETHGIVLNNCTNVDIHDVYIESVGDECIDMHSGSDNITVRNSHFKDCVEVETDAAGFLGIGKSSNVRVVDNYFDYTGASSQATAAAIQASCAAAACGSDELHDIYIARNEIVDALGSGIVIAPNDGALTGLKIEDNIIRNPAKNGIRLNPGTTGNIQYPSITGNQILGGGSSFDGNTGAGIYITTNAGTCSTTCTGGWNNTVACTDVWDCSEFGGLLSENIIQGWGDTADTDEHRGIYVKSGGWNISDNHVTDARLRGIESARPVGMPNTIRDNTVHTVNGSGIYIEDSDVALSNNVETAANCIYVEAGIKKGLVGSNVLEGCTTNGIRLNGTDIWAVGNIIVDSNNGITGSGTSPRAAGNVFINNTLDYGAGGTPTTAEEIQADEISLYDDDNAGVDKEAARWTTNCTTTTDGGEICDWDLLGMGGAMAGTMANAISFTGVPASASTLVFAYDSLFDNQVYIKSSTVDDTDRVTYGQLWIDSDHTQPANLWFTNECGEFTQLTFDTAACAKEGSDAEGGPPAVSRGDSSIRVVDTGFARLQMKPDGVDVLSATDDSGVPKVIIGADDATTQLQLPASDDLATPTIGFGTGFNTGIYETSDGVLATAHNGTATRGWDIGEDYIRTHAGGIGMYRSCNLVTPCFQNNTGDPDTGIGFATDSVSLIGGGVQILGIVEGATGQSAGDGSVWLPHNAGGTDPDARAGGVYLWSETDTLKFRVAGGTIFDLSAPSFDTITSGTNTTADMVVGSGSTLMVTGSGELHATAEMTLVWNDTGATLYQCTAVYISGFNIPNDLITIAIADADAGFMPALGFVENDCVDGSICSVISGGTIDTVETLTAGGETWTEGDDLFVNDSGTAANDSCENTLTNVRPANTDDSIQAIGHVIRVNPTIGKIHIAGAGRINDVPNLEDAKLWVGNVSNVATAVSASGDATISNSGVVAVANDSHDHTALTISGLGPADISALTEGDLASLNNESLALTSIQSTEILIGTGIETAAYASLSGDATMTSAGVVTVADDSHSHTASTLPATEVRSMYWGAGAMEVDGTNCTTPTAVALVTSGPTPLTIACADSDSATISGSTSMPDSWDGGTVTFELTLGQIAASTGAYEMDFEGQCIGHDEPFLAFAGTGEQAAAITLTADDDNLTGTTAAVTLNGTTCAGGDTLVWRGAIDATASASSIETLAVVVGVKMEYVSDIGD